MLFDRVRELVVGGEIARNRPSLVVDVDVELRGRQANGAIVECLFEQHDHLRDLVGCRGALRECMRHKGHPDAELRPGAFVEIWTFLADGPAGNNREDGAHDRG